MEKFLDDEPELQLQEYALTQPAREGTGFLPGRSGCNGYENTYLRAGIQRHRENHYSFISREDSEYRSSASDHAGKSIIRSH